MVDIDEDVAKYEEIEAVVPKWPLGLIWPGIEFDVTDLEVRVFFGNNLIAIIANL